MKRRRNPGSSSMGPILTLGAVAVGGYFLYKTFFANALPADAQYLGQAQAAGTFAAGMVLKPGVNTAAVNYSAGQYLYWGPSEKQIYATSTAPTAAVSAAVTTSAASNAPAVSTTVTTGGAPVAPVVAPPAPVGPSLASIYSNVLAGASIDPNFTGSGDALDSTGYRWNVYTGLALPGKAVPSLPGLDLSQNMTASQYWAAMAPALSSAYGLSGLGDDTVLDQQTGITYDMAGNVVSDLTVSPSTAGQGLNTLTGKVTPAASMSSTTMLAIAAAALVGIILLTGDGERLLSHSRVDALGKA